MKRLLVFLAAPLLLSGCMTARLQFSDKWDPKRKPTYVDYMDYYLLGLVGRREISLQTICIDQRPHGLHKVKTGEDTLITLLTLGIYSPVTVKVWCGE